MLVGGLSLSVTKRIKKYGCISCGIPFEVHPPDDFHTSASRNEKECETRGVVKMDYACQNCGTINTIYWCRRRKFPEWYA